jgi:Leucine-rich repeat (LRR) protein
MNTSYTPNHLDRDVISHILSFYAFPLRSLLFTALIAERATNMIDTLKKMITKKKPNGDVFLKNLFGYMAYDNSRIIFRLFPCIDISNVANKLVSNPKLLKYINPIATATYLNAAAISTVFQKMDISQCFVNKSPLRTLDLYCFPLESVKFITRCRELEYLDLSNTKILKFDHILSELTKLKTLKLGNAAVNCKNDLCDLSTTVTKLDLYGCAINNEDVKYLMNRTHIRSLNIKFNSITDDSAKYLENKNLTALDVSSNMISDEWMRSIAQLPFLRTLNISALFNVSKSGLEELTYGECVTSLTRLDIQYCSAPQGLDHLTNLVNLKLLDVSFSSLENYDHTQRLGMLPSLTHLRVNNCKLTDEQAASLVNNMSETVLILEIKENLITDSFLVNLTSHNSTLKELYLDKNCRLAGTSVGILHSHPSLTTLSVSDTNLTSLDQLLSSETLTSLDISANKLKNCTGILEPLRSNRTLKRLIAKHTGMQDKHLAPLVENTTLTELNLDYCPIRNDDAIILLEQNSGLRYLSLRFCRLSIDELNLGEASLLECVNLAGSEYLNYLSYNELMDLQISKPFFNLID